MVEGARIKVGIDYDGVVIKKAKNWDIPRRASKMGLPTLPGAIEGINALHSQPDVDVVGVYTVRPEWLRKRQTVKQVHKRGIPVEKIVHTNNSSSEKIARLLLDAAYPHRTQSIVLIDDSIDKVIAGAKQLAEEKSGFTELLKLFTLAAFNPKQPERIRGLIIPNVIHVVSMQSWSDLPQMLDEVRVQGLRA